MTQLESVVPVMGLINSHCIRYDDYLTVFVDKIEKGVCHSDMQPVSFRAGTLEQFFVTLMSIDFQVFTKALPDFPQNRRFMFLRNGPQKITCLVGKTDIIGHQKPRQVYGVSWWIVKLHPCQRKSSPHPSFLPVICGEEQRKWIHFLRAEKECADIQHLKLRLFA